MLLLPSSFLFMLIGCPTEENDKDTENTPPSSPLVRISPEEAGTTADLQAVIVQEASDPDGDPIDYTYVWYKDSILQADLITDMVPADRTQKGEVWRVEVTPHDGVSEGAMATAERLIVNTLPVISLEINPVNPNSTQDIQAIPTVSDADGDAVTVHYAWSRNGQGVPQDSDQVSANETEHGDVWSVIATPADPEGEGAAASATVTIENIAPVVLSVALTPEMPYVSDDIVADVSVMDSDGDAVALNYTWYVDGDVVQSGESNTLVAGSFSKHQRVQVEVLPSDAWILGMPQVSAEVVVQNSRPSGDFIEINPTVAYTDTTLSCVVGGFVDADGDAEAWQYRWTVGGVTVANGQTLDGSFFNRGDIVSCTGTPDDGEALGDTLVATSIEIVNTAPMGTSVAITPDPAYEASVLLCQGLGFYDADGDSANWTYTWMVNGNLVPTMGASLSGGDFSRGDSVICSATPEDGSVAGGTLLSLPLVISNTPPVLASVELSSYYPQEGDTISVILGTAQDDDGDSIDFLIDWFVNGNYILSAETLSSDDFQHGDSIYALVTPMDQDARGGAVQSATAIVANTPPDAPVIVLSPEAPRTGDDLVCAVEIESVDRDGDGIVYHFSWTRNGVAYTNASDQLLESRVSGLDLVAGDHWSCEVRADDGIDMGDPVSIAVDVDAACDNSQSFNVIQTVRTELETVNADVMDIDGDGYDDILFINQLSSSVTIWWGGANGVASAESTVGMGRVGYEVDAGDINGDGYADLVGSNQDYSRYTVVFGTGPRQFGGPTYVSQSGFPQGVTLVDADRDGDLDLVSILGAGWGSNVGYNCTITRLNDGNGNFAASGCWQNVTHAQRAIDLDGDGYSELLESTTGRVYSSASGSFVYSFTLNLAGINIATSALYPYDVDSDGDMDVVAEDGSTFTLTTFLNDGMGGLSACGSSVTQSRWAYGIGDLDADGDIDYVSLSTCSFCSSSWYVGLMN